RRPENLCAYTESASGTQAACRRSGHIEALDLKASVPPPVSYQWHGFLQVLPPRRWHKYGLNMPLQTSGAVGDLVYLLPECCILVCTICYPTAPDEPGPSS